MSLFHKYQLSSPQAACLKLVTRTVGSLTFSRPDPKLFYLKIEPLWEIPCQLAQSLEGAARKPHCHYQCFLSPITLYKKTLLSCKQKQEVFSCPEQLQKSSCLLVCWLVCWSVGLLVGWQTLVYQMVTQCPKFFWKTKFHENQLKRRPLLYLKEDLEKTFFFLFKEDY